MSFGSGLMATTTTPVVPRSTDRTVYHVFAATQTTVDIDLLSFALAAPTAPTLRYGGTTNNCLSDEAAFNSTGTYTPDTSVHVLKSEYHNGALSRWILDGNTIVQSGDSAFGPEAATLGFQLNGDALNTGYSWYATFVVNRLTTPTEDVQMLMYLQGIY